MRKWYLQKFIDKHPNHFLTPYFETMVQNDIVEFNTTREIINSANKQQKLNQSEINQVDILMANMSLARD